jgi:hypothetical protein
MKDNLKKITAEEEEARKVIQASKDKLNVLSGGKQSITQLLQFAGLRDKGCQI